MLKSTTDNKKVKSSLILNVTSTKNCPSKALGLCPFFKDCYGSGYEVRPTVLRDRLNREKLWDIDSIEEIIWSLSIDYKAKACKNNPPRAVRYNETGDFKNQEDVNKMVSVLTGFKEWVQEQYGEDISLYGYTKRTDLDLTDLKRATSLNLGRETDIEGVNHFIAKPLEEYKELPEDALRCLCSETLDIERACVDRCDLCLKHQDSPIYTILETREDAKAIKEYKRERDALRQSQEGL